MLVLGKSWGRTGMVELRTVAIPAPAARMSPVRRTRRLQRPGVQALLGGQRRTALPALGRQASGRSVQEVKGVGAVVDEVDAGPVGRNGQAEQSAVAVRARWRRAGVQHFHSDLLAVWR